VTFKNLEQGKLYDITWIDISETPSGHPDDAPIKIFKHTYHWHSRKYVAIGRKKHPYLVFTSGYPPDFLHCICLPEGCIHSIVPVDTTAK
jgi:hypothetical protein